MLPNTKPLTITEVATAKVILIVEHDDANAGLLMQVLLRETAYQAYLATDSIAALQLISHVKPDLFILDYRLPGMNGIQLYDSLHTCGEFKETPVLMLSACLEYYQEEIGSHKLLALAKPFDVDNLLFLIEEVLVHSSNRSSRQPVPV